MIVILVLLRFRFSAAKFDWHNIVDELVLTALYPSL